MKRTFRAQPQRPSGGGFAMELQLPKLAASAPKTIRPGLFGWVDVLYNCDWPLEFADLFSTSTSLVGWQLAIPDGAIVTRVDAELTVTGFNDTNLILSVTRWPSGNTHDLTTFAWMDDTAGYRFELASEFAIPADDEISGAHAVRVDLLTEDASGLYAGVLSKMRLYLEPAAAVA